MTAKSRPDNRVLMICLVCSLLAHLAFSSTQRFFDHFKLGAAVLLSQAVVVDLREPAAPAPLDTLPPTPPAAASPAEDGASREAGPDGVPAAEPQAHNPKPDLPLPPAQAATATPPPAPFAGHAADRVPAEEGKPLAERLTAKEEKPASERLAAKDGKPLADRVTAKEGKPLAERRSTALPEPSLPPLRAAEEFLASDWEKLCYRISMMGIPVGTAELEAKKEKGEVRITLRIKSNPTVSQLYPVDDSVETRHIGGNFIISRIRQREGSFTGDRGFTLFLRDKSVFWIDRLKNLSISEALPNSDVVDILSGLYYLRNQQLEVGKPVVLELFDSNRYAPTTVAVVGRERLRLPGLGEVDTLLVHPQLKTEGVFQRTGEILVWLTDDRNKVPVKVETRVSLGKVTAELVSADTHVSGENPGDDNEGMKKRQAVRP